jgi:regulator of sirC expression with transglutaminase-like and TPR domain
MEKQKMTIHRALSELKLIDSKIEKQISEIIPTGIYQKGKLINGFLQDDGFKENAQSKYQSVNDLISRKIAIKSAIVQANGVTMVKVGEKVMSIADAINFKAAVKFKKQLAARLKQMHNAAVGEMNKNNAIVDQNVQNLLAAALGKDSVKTDAKDVDSIRVPYMDANEFHLFDPLDAEKKVEEIEKEVGDFEMEVDAALSEINALTFIEV